MSQLVGNTQLSNLTITQADTLTVKYTTPVLNSGASIRVYEGPNVPYNNLDGYIVSQTVNSTSGTATLQKNGIDFNDGQYVVVFDVASEASAVGATYNLMYGQPIQPQSTICYVLAQSASSLNVHYQTPHGNTPSRDHDWIALFPGQGAQSGTASNRMSTTYVPTNDSAGNMQISINPPSLETGQWYTIEYAPGHGNQKGISAFYSFQFSA